MLGLAPPQTIFMCRQNALVPGIPVGAPRCPPLAESSKKETHVTVRMDPAGSELPSMECPRMNTQKKHEQQLHIF
jgi:hypothetical protein